MRQTHGGIFKKGNEIFSKRVLGISHLTHKVYCLRFFCSCEGFGTGGFVCVWGGGGGGYVLIQFHTFMLYIPTKRIKDLRLFCFVHARKQGRPFGTCPANSFHHKVTKNG